MKIIARYLTTVLLSTTTIIPAMAQSKMTSEQAINFSKNISPSVNQFANELLADYFNAPDQKNKNVFFSPVSIVTVLAMVGEGAKGQTADEIQKVLHLPKADSNTRLNFEGLISSLHPINKDYQLMMANALWVQKDYTLSSSFINILQTNYDANAKNVDFKLKPEIAVQTINNWIGSNTNNKIKGAISKNDITDKTRLILTNTIYFKADWQNIFAVDATQPDDFFTAEGNVKKAQLMHIQKNFLYYATENAQVLEMPYKNNEVSMVVLLPKKGYTIKDLISTGLSSLFEKNDGNSTLVNVSFPKFKFEAKNNMNGYLQKMGMPTSFGKNADFSGMTGSNDFFISKVVHQTYINVTENGTEAAAATSAVMHMGAAMQIPKEPVYFKADHPFIFILKHNSTGAILFMGLVNDPTAN